jgi:hypothetical protein
MDKVAVILDFPSPHVYDNRRGLMSGYVFWVLVDMLAPLRRITSEKHKFRVELGIDLPALTFFHLSRYGSNRSQRLIAHRRQRLHKCNRLFLMSGVILN